MPYIIHCIPILQDNYCWLIGNENTREVYIVDPGESQPVLQYLQQKQLVVKGILLTHKHHDHIMGIDDIKSATGAKVWGPAGAGYYPDDKIEHILGGGETLALWPEQDAQVHFTPGHTNNHLCYLLNADTAAPSLFCGDTLFSAGCGRILLGGTAEQLKNSLDWIKNLPEKTKLYCSHEYTRANLRFAKTAEPDNKKIDEYICEVERLQDHNIPSLPAKLALERQINPFLRCNSPKIRATLAEKFGRKMNNELTVFTELRQWKDTF